MTNIIPEPENQPKRIIKTIRISTPVYLAIGLLVYTIGYAPEIFTWSDPWLYITMVFWPLAILWELLWILLYVLIVGVVGFGIYYIYYRIKCKINGTKPTPLW